MNNALTREYDTDRYDVVIAGGGMIGTSLALALSPLGIRIAVIEAVERNAVLQPSFDDRTTALSRSTQRSFEAMGLWAGIREASTPISHIHVSEKGRFAFSRIDAEEQGVEALGYVVINRVLGGVLQDALQRSAAVDFICPGKVTSIDTSPTVTDVGVTLNDGHIRRLESSLLVIADGARSSVRDMVGIGAQHTDYDQVAIVGNLQAKEPMRGRAFERFTARGTIAMLPLGVDRSAFIWAAKTADAETLLALDDEAFTAELQKEFGMRIGEFSRLGKRQAYPLSLSRALRMTAHRSVLVGNAAHGLHPVAAQGFNLGMRDVAALSDCIADCLSDHCLSDHCLSDHSPADQQADIGDEAVLARYAAWRRDDQKKLVNFTDGLVHLFGARRGPLRVARGLGMLGFDLIPGVRNEFARQTMGLSGRLPRLSRGMPLQ